MPPCFVASPTLSTDPHGGAGLHNGTGPILQYVQVSHRVPAVANLDSSSLFVNVHKRLAEKLLILSISRILLQASVVVVFFSQEGTMGKLSSSAQENIEINTMPFTEIDGIKTRYEVRGDGPALLMYAPGGFDARIETVVGSRGL